MEIPEDMRKQHGFQPLGAANGPVKNGIFSGNSVRLYEYPRESFLSSPDHFTAMKAAYEQAGPERSNLRYGYVRKAV
jgi:hypothetical protein